MSRYNKDLGDFGEQAAAEHLMGKGYTILERNYRCRAGELDLVARKEQWLVFVEVKTRSSRRYGQPAEAVGYKKQIHMRRVAAHYLSCHPTRQEIRFDVVEVYAELQDGVHALDSINHIENVVLQDM